MIRLRVYTDTSVFGGCEDAEFRSSSLQLFDRFARGDSIIVLSSLTLRELESAPRAVQRVLARIPKAHVERVRINEQAEFLANAYVTEGAISPKMYFDALHIAIASVSRVDALVSWNFKHIVNLRRIRVYNEINVRYGYNEIEIRTPSEVVE